MKLALLLTLVPLPLCAWEFSPDPICTLSSTAAGPQVTVTYDATLPEYTISVRTDAFAWPDGIFFIAFEGPRSMTISTDRHTVSTDRATLTVQDAGFGNVLDGLEFSETATAGVGQADVTIPLDGIGPQISAFRACPKDQPATS